MAHAIDSTARGMVRELEQRMLNELDRMTQSVTKRTTPGV